MTATNPVNIDSSIPELWAKLTLRDSLRAGFWQKFVGGEGSRSPIIRRSELLNSPGDTIHIQTGSPLTGSGVTGDTATLEGQEEAMSLASIKVIPVYRRHAVLLNNRGVKKSIVDMRSEAKMRLAEWAQEKMDDVRFANFVDTDPMNGETYTPEFTVVGGGTTGASDVGTTDLLDVQSLQIAKLDLYNNRAKPLMEADGNEYFGGVFHPNTLYNLKRSDEYRDWVREAQVRGNDNPFFKGAVAMIDGILIFQHNNVPSVAGSPDVSSNVLFGAEAFVEGLDEGVTWFEKEFDYNLQHGVSFGFAFQPRRGLAINSAILFASSEAP